MNIWDKGRQHIAGNSNIHTLKHFPIVTEVCAQYVRRAEFLVDGAVVDLQSWLRHEWRRSGLPFTKANEACGVSNAASRKYLSHGSDWYAPSPEAFGKLVLYANENGEKNGRPYFSANGERPLTVDEYARLFPTFHGQYGVTNVWHHPPLRGRERVKKTNAAQKSAHPNQKPLALIRLILQASSNSGDIIWVPFGGLCTTGIASLLLPRQVFCAEHNPAIFSLAVKRLEKDASQGVSTGRVSSL